MTKLLQAVSAAAMLAFGATAALAQTASPPSPTQSPTGTPSQQPQGGADTNAKVVPVNPPDASAPPPGMASGSRPLRPKTDMENQAPSPTKDTKSQKKSPN